MNVFEANTTSPVTVSFNGGSVLTIKTNSGSNVDPGGFVAGMIVMGIVSGATFRLISDQASSAIVAAAEAAKDAAQAAKDIAVDAADRAEAAAAAVNLPLPVAETYLRQKTDLSGYETRTPTQVVSDLALPLKVAFFGHIRENAFPSIMQWVTDPGASDWAGYFNAAFAAIAAVSQYKGTTIIVPGERQIQVSQCNPILSCGVYLEGSGRVNWPDRVTAAEDAAMIYGLGGTQDVFTWGNGGNGNVRGGGVRNMSVHMDNKLGGSAIVFNGVWGFKVEDVEIMGCYDAVRILGGYDPVLRDLRIEGYRNTGITAEGTATLRGDRLNMRNVSVAGRGTETSMTSTGDAVRILGNWHSADIDCLRLVKCGRYGLNLESQYTDPDLFPHYISIDNLQFDYGNNSGIFATHVQDFKLDKGYFNSNLNGNQMNFGTNATEIMLSKMRCFGSRNRVISFLGKTMSVTESTFRGWDKANTNEAAITGDNSDGVKIHGNYFGPVGRFTTDPDSAGNLAYYQVGNGSVSIQGNTTKGLAASPFSVPGGAPQSIANNVIIP